MKLEVPVNWVEELGAAIANEEVLPDGTSEREAINCSQTNAPMDAQNLPMRVACWLTWMTLTGQSLSRTCSATGLKSAGANVTFKVKGTDKEFTVFTTRQILFSVRPSLFWRLNMN